VLTQYPWQVVDAVIFGQDVEGRVLKSGCGVMLVAKDELATHTGTEPHTPRHPIRWRKQDWIISELPGPSRKSDGRSVTVGIGAAAPAATNDISWQDTHQSNIDSSEGDQATQFEAFFDGCVNTLQNVIELTRRQRALIVCWHELLEQLVKLEEGDPAQMALIVELADEIPSTVTRIRHAPRRVLRRKRQQERLHRIRQLDGACIVNYAQRPGRNLQEKAGPKHRLLAVARIESHDVLENRVYLDFCNRAIRASKIYAKENSHVDKTQSERLRQVSSFAHLCYSSLTDHTFADVRRIAAPCRKPNYTLTDDLNYRKVWGAYNRLLKDEEVKDEVWQWQRRVWADTMRIFLSLTIHHLDLKVCFDIREFPYDVAVRIRKEQFAGQWLFEETLPGPVVFGFDENYASLYLIDGTGIDKYMADYLPPEAPPLSLLMADVYMIWFSSSTEKICVLPIWALVGGPEWECSDAPKDALVDDIQSSCRASVSAYSAHLSKTESAVTIPSCLILKASWDRSDSSFHMTPPSDETPVILIELNNSTREWSDATIPKFSGKLADLIFSQLAE